MARKVDWLDYAHKLDVAREEMQDRLPEGVECSLVLSAYGRYSAAEFCVYLRCKDDDLSASGSGRTVDKALAEAMEDLAKKVAEQQRRPRLVPTKPRAIEGRAS